MTKFEKLRISMRYWLTGAHSVNKNYLMALEAFNLAEELAIGFRKDGTTPAFLHQLEVMAYITTILPSVRDPIETICAALLHDTLEDSYITLEEIEGRFGVVVSDAVRLLSKTINGECIYSKDKLGMYFDEMLNCPIATLVKGADRINNQGTMTGIFSNEKQLEYVKESEEFILPMLKKARRLYPDQEAAYENIKLVLNNQILLVKAITG